MKRLKQLWAYFKKSILPTLIIYAIVDRDRLSKGIFSMDWILLIQIVGAILAIYLIFTGIFSIQKFILNDKKDVECRKLIEDMQKRHDASDVVRHDLFQEEYKKIKSEYNKEIENLLEMNKGLGITIKELEKEKSALKARLENT